jgi:large subunit ribosomal protein L30
MNEAKEIQSEVKVEEPKLEAEVKSEESKVNEKSKAKMAIILVRGLVGVTQGVKDTLKMLKLTRKNQCVIVKKNPVYLGMVKKVKDYVTWGEITDDTFKEIIETKGEEYKGRLKDGKEKYNYKTLEIGGKKYKKYFRLNPPKKGFGRKGIKVPFKIGGALGYREDKINDLIKRML